jgi:TonB family protein
MRGSIALIAAVLWIAATTETLPQTGAPSGATSDPSQSASPQPAGRAPRVCEGLRAVASESGPLKHTPLVSVHVRPDGSVHDPVLVQSSGDGDVDQAVLSCASGSRIEAIAVSGNSPETVWVVGYYWQSGWSGFAPAGPDGKAAASCEDRPFSPPSDKNVAAKDTVLSYVIGTDGLVRNVAVVVSSGASDLDRQTMNCVSTWRFFPVYRKGAAVEVERSYTVKWQAR